LKTQICIKGDEISFANGKGKKKWGDGWCVFARISNSPYLLNPGTTPYYLMWIHSCEMISRVRNILEKAAATLRMCSAAAAAEDEVLSRRRCAFVRDLCTYFQSGYLRSGIHEKSTRSPFSERGKLWSVSRAMLYSIFGGWRALSGQSSHPSHPRTLPLPFAVAREGRREGRGRDYRSSSVATRVGRVSRWWTGIS
jgi:hypothetical protein